MLLASNTRPTSGVECDRRQRRPNPVGPVSRTARSEGAHGQAECQGCQQMLARRQQRHNEAYRPEQSSEQNQKPSRRRKQSNIPALKA